jgi:ABC-type tungstate transport system substrate-binding protein
MLVGGNIRGYTPTMTTAIVLVTLTVGLSAAAFWIGRRI